MDNKQTVMHDRSLNLWHWAMVVTFISIVLNLFVLFQSASDVAAEHNLKTAQIDDNSIKYRIRLYPPGGAHWLQKVWIEDAALVLRQNGYAIFLWAIDQSRVIDITCAKAPEATKTKIQDLFKKNRINHENIKIDIKNINGIKTSYDIELIYDQPLDEDLSTYLQNKSMWTWDVDKILKKEGYTIFETHHRHMPTILDIPYPPWHYAERIIKLVTSNNLRCPETYHILRHDDPALNSSINLLLGIKSTETGFRITGRIPLKSMTESMLSIDLKYKVYVKDVNNNSYFSKFTWKATAPILVNYPENFTPKPQTVIPGKYYLKIFIDNEIVWSTRLELTKNNRINWNHHQYKYLKE